MDRDLWKLSFYFCVCTEHLDRKEGHSSMKNQTVYLVLLFSANQIKSSHPSEGLHLPAPNSLAFLPKIPCNFWWTTVFVFTCVGMKNARQSQCIKENELLRI